MDALPLTEQEIWREKSGNEEESVLQVPREFRTVTLRRRNPVPYQQGEGFKYRALLKIMSRLYIT